MEVRITSLIMNGWPYTKVGVGLIVAKKSLEKLRSFLFPAVSVSY